MAMKKEHYRAFEDILGPENISDDPVILYPYSWRSGLYAGMEKFTPRFEAAVLPQNTKEVQAVVKLCNKLKLQYKASSTGWGPYNDASGPGVIKIDLRRMNRILEINEVGTRLLGYSSKEECLGKSVILEHFADPGDRQKVLLR